MATNKQISYKLGLTLWMAAFVVLPNVSSAAPGTLASVPLFTQANADPNIMLHLDSSGSMNHVMVESTFEGTATYDAATTYDADPDTIIFDTCSGGLIPVGNTIYLRVNSGNPKILISGTEYDLGNDAGEKCFDPAEEYLARLTTYPTLPIGLTYSGNFLNWYFNAGTTTGTWVDDKPQTRNRSDVAKDSLVSLVDSLINVRVGVSSFRKTTSPFNAGLGASITEEIDDLDVGTQRTDVTTAINNTVADGGTPLAESLRDLGRYFSNDSSTNCGGGITNLTLHPGSTNDPEPCTDVLGDTAPMNNLAGPITEQCQSNFVIFTTDGLATVDIGTPSDRLGDSPLEDYDLDCTQAHVDAGTCTDVYDKKFGTTYTTHSEASDYLDDVAQALYEMDLRPDLNDAAGNAVTNNVRTFVVGFADETVANNQLLIDTANQGGGSFIYADDSSELQTALESATSSILNLIGSAAAVTFNSATLGTNSAVYLALFNSSSWSGDLVAYDLNDTTGAIETQAWSAATRLDARANAVNSRTILTYNGTGGIPFRWPADHNSPTAAEIDTTQINDLITGASGSATTAQLDTLGQARVDFLRGDTTNEGNTVSGLTFRGRTSRLGDIVHAGPVFVGAPELSWPNGDGSSNDFPSDTNAYSVYKYNTSTDTNPGKADRPGVVYVGSNDGLLHGFATETGTLGTAGDEVLAYAPRALFSAASGRGYHYLTESGYNHQYYVDLVPTVSDIYDATNGWQTILVGGLRGGGQAIFALDVTDPEDFSEANASSIVKWEFTNADEADLGYTFSRPSVALMENGRWAIIVGNGYDDSASATGSGEASLLILFMDANLSDGTWDLGSDYLKISTGVGNTTTRNGLSTPAAVDMDGNGQVDRVYAGDLLGNMWAFDLSGTNANNWDSAYKQGTTPKALFIAGSGQPITSQPEIVLNPDVTTAAGNSPNTLVLFGTGQYVSSTDNANLGDQTFYGVWDHGTSERLPTHLVEQELVESGGTRTITNAAVDYATKDGWFINFDLNSDGERLVTNPVVRGDIVYFNTSIPTDVTCSYGGTGWQMSVQYVNGNNPEAAVFDSDGNGIVNTSDTALSGAAFEQGLPAAPSFLSNRRYTPGTRTLDGNGVVDDAVEELSGLSTGRLSWEELSQ